jgi:hypothetical protein
MRAGELCRVPSEILEALAPSSTSLLLKFLRPVDARWLLLLNDDLVIQRSSLGSSIGPNILAR